MVIDEWDYMWESVCCVVEVIYDFYEFWGSFDLVMLVCWCCVVWFLVVYFVWVGLILVVYCVYLSGLVIFGLYFGFGVVLVVFLSYWEYFGVVVVLLLVFVFGLVVLIFVFFVYVYQVGEEVGQNGWFCYVDQVQLQDVIFMWVFFGVVEVCGYFISVCDMLVWVKLLVEVVDYMGYIVGCYEVFVNFG